MAQNKNATEEVVDTGKKVVKSIIRKKFGFLLKIIISIVLPLILLVSCLYVIFNKDTADQDLDKFEGWLENDDTINYE